MARTRTGLLVGLVALGLSAGACDSGKKKDAAGGPAAGGGDGKSNVTLSDVQKGAGAVQGAAGDDLALLPANSEVVMGLNFAQLQQSALWKQFAPGLMSKASAGLGDFKTKCGFDPMESVKSFSMGMKGLGGNQPDGVVVLHGPDKAKISKCVETMKADAQKEGVEITVDGDVFMVKGKRGETSGFTYIGNDTLLGVMGPAVTKDSVLAAAKGGSALKTSQAFLEMYGKINTKDSLWVLINGNAPFMSEAAKAGVKPKAVFGSVNVTDGLAVDLRVRLATPDEANNLVTMAKQQTSNPQIKNLFDKLDIGADGADVKVDLAMSQQKLMALVGLLGGALGGALGGGGMGGGMGGP